MKPIYIKRDYPYWITKAINKHSMRIWYTLIVIMVLFVVWTLINHAVNSKPLISPVYAPIVKQIQASERVYISCETPEGYLECQVYNGNITWQEHDRLAKIIKCESGWNPDAHHVNTNGSVDRGLFQINSIHKTISNQDSYDFKKNIDFGIKLFKRQGYTPWVCNKKI